MKTRIIILLWVLLAGLTGCYDYSNFDNIAVDPFSPSFVFPLMKSKISFKELAEKSGANALVEQHPGSDMYYLTFRDTIDLGLATNLFTLPPVTFNANCQIPTGLIPAIFPFPSIPISQTFDQNYNSFSKAELKRIDLSGGTLQVTLTNNINHNFNGDLTISSLKNQSGNPLVLSFSLSAANPTYSTSIDLNGYYLDLLDPPSTYNNFKYSINATISYGGTASFVGDNLAIQISITDPTFQQVTGKVYYKYIHANQPYSIGIFNSTVLAEQHLDKPKFSLNFVNSFGLPSNVNFTHFDVVNNHGDTTKLQNDLPTQTGDLLIGSPNILKYATTSKPSDSTKLVLSNTNSNIENVFDGAPKTLSFGATFNIGDTLDPSHNYFVRNDSKFKLLSDIEIPLNGWVVTNEIADTIKNVDWPNLEKDLNLINDGQTKVKLKFRFANELPLNMYLQVFFLDSLGTKVAQLFDTGSEQFVKSSPVNTVSGESTGSTEAYCYISIDWAKYDEMSKSQNMVIYYKFTTGGNLHQNITILSSNSIAVGMSLEISGTIKPKL